MSYRNENILRVHTLSSRESTGRILYHPSYFAHLASSPNPGDVPTPCQAPTVPRSRESRGALIVLSVGVFLLALSYFTDGPVSVVSGAGCAVWTLAGAWVTR